SPTNPTPAHSTSSGCPDQQHPLITRTLNQPCLGTGPVSAEYLKRHLLHQDVYLERIRGDRVLHEALTAGADPLHLALVFNLSHTAASRYAAIAQNLLDDQSDGAL
ncbi:hypothetical protein ABZV45_44755, partial [Streptomyces sp. NPDC005077]